MGSSISVVPLSTRIFALLLTAGCGVAGVAGFLSGEAPVTPLGSAGGAIHSSRIDRASGPGQQSPRAGDRREQLRELVRRGLVSRASELEAWALIQDLPLDQVEQELRQILANSGDSEEVSHERLLLCSRLAEANPKLVIELAANADESYRYGMTHVALVQWMKTDPEAAYAWAKDDPDEQGSMLSKMMAKVYANSGLEQALEQSASLRPQVRAEIISQFASDACGSAEARQSFLEAITAHGSAEELESSRKSLLLFQVRVDPAATLEECASRPEDRDQIAGLFKIWMRSDPAAAAQWGLAHPELQPDSRPDRGYKSLVFREPEQAEQLLPVLEKIPGFMENLMEDLQKDYARGGWTPYGTDTFAVKTATDALRSHYQRWSNNDSAAAHAWREALPPDLRSVVDSNQ